MLPDHNDGYGADEDEEQVKPDNRVNKAAKGAAKKSTQDGNKAAGVAAGGQAVSLPDVTLPFKPNKLLTGRGVVYFQCTAEPTSTCI